MRTRRTKVVIHTNHPIRRAASRSVVIHPARKVVVVGVPRVYLPVVTFAAVVATLPPRERLTWQDTETIAQEEEWTEVNFGVDDRGDALYLGVDGSVELDFADITYENDDLQVVDFNERTYSNRTYRLLDIPDRRNVKTLRLLAQAKSEEATLRLYLS